jgi:hypothetical protein
MGKRKRAKIAAMLTAAVGLATWGLTGSAGANLPGSTFEGNDGNLVVNTPGNTDWTNAPNRHIGTDLPTGQNDNSFGNGTKEDNVNVTVGTGSIPNSKADLASFYEANEQLANGHIMLYLGWSRVNQNGTTNFDFEINQKAQPDLTTIGAKTLVRTSGDFLINYLFQGQGTPTVNVRTWGGSAWNAPVDASAFSEAAINSVPVANIAGQLPDPLPAAQFGELAIDLTAAGVFPPNTCEAFGSAYVKSRSSTSFTSEIKDFIAPVAINVANCATIIVKKVTVPSPDPTSQAFTFTSNFADPLSFSLKDGQSKTTTGLNPGNSYSVSETVPTGWVSDGGKCDDGSSPSAISLQQGETVTCTFTNTGQGRLITKKVTDPTGSSQSFGFHSNAPAANTTFSLTDGQSNDSGAINAGTYAVSEDTPLPTNWVAGTQSCDDGSPVSAVVINPGETVTCTFHNTLNLGTVKVSKTHKVPGQGAQPEANVTFAVQQNGTTVGSATTNAQGVACVSGLSFGSYTVHETVPTGESPDGQDKPVTVNTRDLSTDCSGSGTTPISFVNTPLTNLSVHVASQVAGATSSTISCTGTGGPSAGPGSDITASATGLSPGTYVCTVVIDP